jgi:hypothetical protein
MVSDTSIVVSYDDKPAPRSGLSVYKPHSTYIYIHLLSVIISLLDGFRHVLFSIIYGMSSFPLTLIFQDGWNHQPDIFFLIYLTFPISKKKIHRSHHFPWRQGILDPSGIYWQIWNRKPTDLGQKNEKSACAVHRIRKVNLGRLKISKSSYIYIHTYRCMYIYIYIHIYIHICIS